jgi:hypothetical protein
LTRRERGANSDYEKSGETEPKIFLQAADGPVRSVNREGMDAPFPALNFGIVWVGWQGVVCDRDYGETQPACRVARTRVNSAAYG